MLISAIMSVLLTGASTSKIEARGILYNPPRGFIHLADESPTSSGGRKTTYLLPEKSGNRVFIVLQVEPGDNKSKSDGSGPMKGFRRVSSTAFGDHSRATWYLGSLIMNHRLLPDYRAVLTHRKDCVYVDLVAPSNRQKKLIAEFKPSVMALKFKVLPVSKG